MSPSEYRILERESLELEKKDALFILPSTRTLPSPSSLTCVIAALLLSLCSNIILLVSPFGKSFVQCAEPKTQFGK